jgi:hypothetical protein
MSDSIYWATLPLMVAIFAWAAWIVEQQISALNKRIEQLEHPVVRQ